MEHKMISAKVLLLAMSLSTTACQKLDVEGIFISDETANKRFAQSVEWNKNHPFREIVVPSDNYRIMSMADSHVGSTNNLDIFLEIAKKSNVSAVVMAGDLTNGLSNEYDKFQQHLPNQDSLPSFQLAGNHDLTFGGWNQFYSRFGSSTYLFTIKTPVARDLYICLESGSATLGNKQYDWLCDILQNVRPDYRNCIVFTHTNFFRFRHTESTNPPNEEITALMELFIKSRVNIVVQGHEHTHSAEYFGNTLYLVVDAITDGLTNAGYLLMNMKNGNPDYEFINLSSK